jgi:signal peptidase I
MGGKSRNRTRTAFFAAAAGIALGLALKLFAADIRLVSGPSMEPAITEGERIFILKLAYGIALPFSSELLVLWAAPKKNDVVVYIYDNKTVVKRCAAVEGDAVKADIVFSQEDYGLRRVPRYQINMNGQAYPLSEAQYHRFKDAGAVPAGMIFTVGDNLEESVDSRHYGFVSVRNMLGKVICK